MTKFPSWFFFYNLFFILPNHQLFSLQDVLFLLISIISFFLQIAKCGILVPELSLDIYVNWKNIYLKILYSIIAIYSLVPNLSVVMVGRRAHITTFDNNDCGKSWSKLFQHMKRRTIQSTHDDKQKMMIKLTWTSGLGDP